MNVLKNNSTFQMAVIGLMLLFAPVACGQANEPDESSNFPTPDWLTFEQATAEARETEKTVLVAVYVDWCGWCQRLDQEVYADQEVRSFMNEHFKAARLDAESTKKMRVQGEDLSERDLAQALGASGFPNTVFLNSEMEYITRVPGFLPKNDFMNVLKFVAEGAYEDESFEDFIERQ